MLHRRTASWTAPSRTLVNGNGEITHRPVHRRAAASRVGRGRPGRRRPCAAWIDARAIDRLRATGPARHGARLAARRHPRRRTEVGDVVPLFAGELVLLAVALLLFVVSAAATQRRPGGGPGPAARPAAAQRRRAARRELAGPVLLGIPLGALVAVGALTLARSVWLPPGVPFVVGSPALVALGVALLVQLLVIALVARRLVREPVDTLLRRVPVRGTRVRLGPLEVGVACARRGRSPHGRELRASPGRSPCSPPGCWRWRSGCWPAVRCPCWPRGSGRGRWPAGGSGPGWGRCRWPAGRARAGCSCCWSWRSPAWWPSPTAGRSRPGQPHRAGRRRGGCPGGAARRARPRCASCPPPRRSSTRAGGGSCRRRTIVPPNVGVSVLAMPPAGAAAVAQWGWADDRPSAKDLARLDPQLPAPIILTGASVDVRLSDVAVRGGKLVRPVPGHGRTPTGVPGSYDLGPLPRRGRHGRRCAGRSRASRVAVCRD